MLSPALSCAPGQRAAFLKEFRALIPLVRAESGCIEYGAAVDIASGLAMQSAMRENVVTVVEKWTDLEALKKHLQAPHMVAYRPKVKDFVVQTKLDVLAPAD